jgi:hypothetical protein
MRYAQPFKAAGAHGAFSRLWHRRHQWRMRYKETRRCQNNPLRWLCLYQRRRGRDGAATGVARQRKAVMPVTW